jgi:hypothetical protein
MGTLLISAMIAIGFVTIANCSNLALAQYSTNTQSTPSSGEPSTSSGPRVPPSSPQSQIHQPPTEANPASTGNNATVAGNNTTVAGNGTTIGPPPITIVGPSSFTASPITNENQVNVNTTSTTLGNESSLGVPAQ